MKIQWVWNALSTGKKIEQTCWSAAYYSVKACIKKRLSICLAQAEKTWSSQKDDILVYANLLIKTRDRGSCSNWASWNSGKRQFQRFGRYGLSEPSDTKLQVHDWSPHNLKRFIASFLCSVWDIIEIATYHDSTETAKLDELEWKALLEPLVVVHRA